MTQRHTGLKPCSQQDMRCTNTMQRAHSPIKVCKPACVRAHPCQPMCCITASRNTAPGKYSVKLGLSIHPHPVAPCNAHLNKTKGPINPCMQRRQGARMLRSPPHPPYRSHLHVMVSHPHSTPIRGAGVRELHPLTKPLAGPTLLGCAVLC